MNNTAPLRDLLMVEDLMLLLMDDDGASVQGAGTLHYARARARAGWGGPHRTRAARSGGDRGHGDYERTESHFGGRGAAARPVATVGVRDRGQTQRVQPLLMTLGADLWRVVLDRLVDRGLLHRKQSRILGVFRSTKFLAADEQHEAQLRARIRRVLEEGQTPDPRTASIIGLLFASGSMPSLRPPLPWTSQTVARAEQLQRGDWGAEAVATAVARTAAGIAAATIAVSTSGR